MIYQAHAGVSAENPANTMPAFLAAMEQGYSVIELDVGATKDLQFVTIHDETINRTARTRDGERLTEEIRVCDCTYEALLAFDYGVAYAKKFAGTTIPLLRDVLSAARARAIRVKIDNKYQRFDPAQRAAFFALLEEYADVAELTCSSVEELEAVARRFPAMAFHYDGAVDEGILARIGALLPKARITVWLPLENARTAWVKVGYADAKKAELVKRHAQLGVWLLSTREELAQAQALGADVIETNGQLKPPAALGAVADMHTHSESSHDSTCPVEAMAQAQMARGTRIFAVTDHYDTSFHAEGEGLEPIVRAYETVQAVNRRYAGQCTALAGIEIGEGFWRPASYERARTLVPYDVIIGSVHLVQYEELTMPYSRIDFSALPRETIAAYLDAYFDDVLTMLDFADLDILAHLTCPLRYIQGKYGIAVDLSPYAEKIERIFRTIIRRGIALEVNTSSYAALGGFMPDRALVEQYLVLGGHLITLGSDAHAAEGASANFEPCLAMLRELGVSNVFYYCGRRAYPMTI